MKIYSEFSKFDKNLDEYTERMMNRQKTEQKIESSDEKNANSCFIHFDSNDPEMMIVKKSKTEEKDSNLSTYKQKSNVEIINIDED